jgi:hypothetical protein
MELQDVQFKTGGLHYTGRRTLHLWEYYGSEVNWSVVKRRRLGNC